LPLFWLTPNGSQLPRRHGWQEAGEDLPRCAAINLHTLLRHGLARRDGAWALAG